MMKKYIYFLTLVFLILFSTSLVSAQLCKGSDGYWNDCDSYYRGHDKDINYYREYEAKLYIHEVEWRSQDSKDRYERYDKSNYYDKSDYWNKYDSYDKSDYYDKDHYKVPFESFFDDFFSYSGQDKEWDEDWNNYWESYLDKKDKYNRYDRYDRYDKDYNSWNDKDYDYRDWRDEKRNYYDENCDKFDDCKYVTYNLKYDPKAGYYKW